MFSPVPMSNFKLLVLQHDERAVLRALADSGAAQLGQTELTGEPMTRRDYTAERQRCAQLISQAEGLRRSFPLQTFAGPPAEAVMLSLAKVEEGLREIAKAVEPLLQRREDLLLQWTSLVDGEEKISKYGGSELPLRSTDEFGFLHFVTGTLPAKTLDSLQSELPDRSALLLLPERSGRQPLIAMSTRGSSQALSLVLQRAGFEPEELPQAEGQTVDSLLEHTRAEQGRLSSLIRQMDAELQTLANRYGKALVQYIAASKIELSVLEVEQNFTQAGSAILITGWVPQPEVAALRERITTITAGRCAFQTTSVSESGYQDHAPVLLQNPRWLRPFEALVTAYGLPQYGELEPTLFVAVSYLLMFGMMFGDVGHGAILAAIGGVCTWKAKNARLQNGGRLLGFAGLSSIAFGFVYGSCFGCAAFKRFALWRDPLEGNPLQLISAAVGLGIAVISLGLVLNVINRFRAGDVFGAIMDRCGLLGIVFYGGAVLMLLNMAAIHSRGLMTCALLLLLVAPVVGWILKEPAARLLPGLSTTPVRPAEGWFGLLAESIVGAFEAILAYLANTISFVRLAAYAMSHAALLAAAFSLAAAVRDQSAGGIVLGWIIVIAGNLVAMMLEGVIASVQALRLEYYEFFSKFFSGTGRPFQPFRLAQTAG